MKRPPLLLLLTLCGDGYDLIDAAGGVNFDLNDDGIREQLSWTTATSDDAWLALDRNGNGIIDGGRELFGNSTPHRRASRAMGMGCVPAKVAVV